MLGSNQSIDIFYCGKPCLEAEPSDQISKSIYRKKKRRNGARKARLFFWTAQGQYGILLERDLGV